jgi:MoxR-like ATPase
MDFNSVVLSLKTKGMNTREIQNDRITTPSMKIPGYSTVTRWLREAQLDQFSETAVDFTKDAEADEIDQPLLPRLEVQPVTSVHDIARLTLLPRYTVHWHLTRSLGFLVHHLRWIPHALTERQKRIRVSNSEQFLAGSCHG